jgi:hypothetical protein
VRLDFLEDGVEVAKVGPLVDVKTDHVGVTTKERLDHGPNIYMSAFLKTDL